MKSIWGSLRLKGQWSVDKKDLENQILVLSTKIRTFGGRTAEGW